MKDFQGFSFYFKPANLTKVVNNKKLLFGLYTLLGYIGYFILIITCLNLYADEKRYDLCGSAETD